MSARQHDVVRHGSLYIGGHWRRPSSDQTLVVHSPVSEELVGIAPAADRDDVDASVMAARDAFDDGEWASMSHGQRSEILRALGKSLSGRRDELARLVTAETGLPIEKWSGAAVDGAVLYCNVFADMATTFDWEEVRQGAYMKFLVRKEPVGVVAAILPWNSPVPLTMWKVAPALLAGCTVIYKPAPETPLHSYVLAEIFDEVGVPPGVFNIVPGGSETGEALVTHPGVDKISFTGSTAAGKRIATLAGGMLKRVSLELGGKSAAVVLEDVDIEMFASQIAAAGMMNNGEACLNQTRVLVPRRRYDEMAEAIRSAVESMKMGDPYDLETDLGPLIAERQRDRVEGLIGSCVDEGGKVILGGGRPADRSRGWWVEPTVLADVHNHMRIAREEIFGPVLTLIPYDGVDDAVSIANDTNYGLDGSVWGGDVDAGLEIARRLRTGHVSVNGFIMDPLQPFGGFKESGIGREGGPEGLEEFTETKGINLPE